MKKFRKILKDGATEPISSVDEKLTKKDVTPERKAKKRHRLVFKAMFVMSIIFIMISVSYSWFTSSDKSTINGLTINVVDTKDLTKGDITIYGELRPVSGDGKNFFVPEKIELVPVIETESESAPEGEEPEEPAETEKPDYIISAYDKNSDNYIALSDDVTAEDLENANINNVVVMQFSLDLSGTAEKLLLMPGTAITPVNASAENLDGAVRVAFLKKGENGYTPFLIWIPDDTHIETVEDENGSLVETDVEESEYIFVSEEGTETIKVENADDAKLGDDVPCVFGDISEDGVLFDNLAGKGEYRCVIWLDGNDVECNSSLFGQKFKLNLNIEPEAKQN